MSAAASRCSLLFIWEIFWRLNTAAPVTFVCRSPVLFKIRPNSSVKFLHWLWSTKHMVKFSRWVCNEGVLTDTVVEARGEARDTNLCLSVLVHYGFMHCFIILLYVHGYFGCMYICAPCVCLVPVEVRRGHQISQYWSYWLVMSHHVGAGN